jgi:hypothetical protein
VKLIITGAAALAALAAMPVLAAVPAVTRAQASGLPHELDAPWADVAPHADRDRVLAAALGLPDERLGRLSARRASARRSAEDRARRAIHAWADAALAAVRASPSTATAVHRAIDERARVARVRALSDGGAVVEIEVGWDALRAAAPGAAGLPWSD